MIKPIKNFVEVNMQGNFSLWINKPIYKIYKTNSGYIKNIKTGENMGQIVELHINLYDDNNNKLCVANYEEDCYEIVEE